MSKFSVILILSFSLVSSMMGKTQRKLAHTDWQPNVIEGEKIVNGITSLQKIYNEIYVLIKNIDQNNISNQTQTQKSLSSIELLLSENITLLKKVSQQLNRII